MLGVETMKCGECNDIGSVILMNPEGERELEECACVHHPEMKMTDEEFLALHAVNDSEE